MFQFYPIVSSRQIQVKKTWRNTFTSRENPRQPLAARIAGFESNASILRHTKARRDFASGTAWTSCPLDVLVFFVCCFCVLCFASFCGVLLWPGLERHSGRTPGWICTSSLVLVLCFSRVFLGLSLFSSFWVSFVFLFFLVGPF